MARPLGRAAILLLAAACTRSQTPPAGPASGRGPSPAAASSRIAPGPDPRTLSPPRAPCLPRAPCASAGALAEAAGSALDDGENERALACAEEAIRIAPRLVPGLAARAGALAALVEASSS